MVQVGPIQIGEGRTKICVPIIETEKKDIIAVAEKLRKEPVDMVEWRMDFFEGVFDREALQEMAVMIKKTLGSIPLLATFRTAAEGGEKPCELATYYEVLLAAVDSNSVDFVDIEMFRGTLEQEVTRSLVLDGNKVSGKELISMLLKKIDHRVPIVGSYHDFGKTPDSDEIITRFHQIDLLGADILKMAVMPKQKEDVYRMMAVTEQIKQDIPQKPLITMSMGELGLVTRLVGETFGSSVTFGCLGKASAPGQVPVNELASIVKGIHEVQA